MANTLQEPRPASENGSPGETITVLVADDHPVVRQGIAQILEDSEDIHVVGAASAGREAIEMTRRFEPEVVVLDYSMGDMDGIQVVTKLREHDNKVRVIIFSMYENVQYAIQAMEVGADGYMVKSDTSDELVGAIRTVYSGKTHITPRLQDQVMQSLGRKKVRTGLELLSRREAELLRCLSRGMILKEAAVHMDITESTASTYRQRILSKLSLENTAQLIRFALDHGLGA